MKGFVHCYAVAIAAFLLIPGAVLAQAPSAGLNVKSEKPQGIIMLSSDLVPDQGRLVFKIVAYNKGAAPVTLDPATITLTTAAGKPVPLASLAQLEDETREAFGGPPAKRPDDYAKMSQVQRPVTVTSSGERDVSGYTGGEAVSSSVSSSSRKKAVDDSDPKLKEALDNLRAAILQPAPVAPRAAAGGNAVTQSFKFGRKEERRLKLALDFAGEHHEFEFEVPR
jgi:hypothetical protein